jgi:hypothetical protein
VTTNNGTHMDTLFLIWFLCEVFSSE